MARDTRIFRVTKHGKTFYKSRIAVSGMFTGSYRRGFGISKVEAANAEATSGWQDVTEEFRNPPAVPRCNYHKTYGGIRRPSIADWKPEEQKRYFSRCICWGLYCSQHPEYPAHLDNCDVKYYDPAKCACQVTKKLLE